MSFELRRILPIDYSNGYLSLLSQLNGFDYTKTCDSQEKFNETIRDNLIYVGVNESNKIVCTGKLVVEKKFGSCVVHIEDVVVDSSFRNLGIGKSLVRELCKIAETHLPYKIILTCDPKFTRFYESCKFIQYGISMKYHSACSQSTTC